jgi:hypothetical protein
MKMILKRNWHALDGSKPSGENYTVIPEGKHEVERIANPYGFSCFWLVLKGTKVGASEGSWRQWVNDGSLVTNPKNPRFGKPIDWGKFEIVIEE